MGQTGSGKSSLARHLAAQGAHAGRPALVVDSQRVDTFRDVPHVAPDVAVKALWPAEGKRRSACVEPSNAEEVDGLMRAVRAGRDVTVLVDEAHHWTAGASRSVELLRLMRGVRHAGSVLILTTQHLSGDIPAAAFSCTNLLIVFRCSGPRALDVLRKEWGLSAEVVKSLPQYHYLTLQLGF